MKNFLLLIIIMCVTSCTISMPDSTTVSNTQLQEQVENSLVIFENVTPSTKRYAIKQDGHNMWLYEARGSYDFHIVHSLECEKCKSKEITENNNLYNW